MKITQLTKLALLILTLSIFVGCSSTSEEVDTGMTQEPEPTDNSQSEAEAAAARAAAAEEQARRSALATRVFYFDFDIADIRDEDRDTLTYHARDLAANPDRSVRLEGHADERGTREYNLALGERRANSILNYLIVNGAARSQLETVSYGEEQPTDRGTNETAYQRNRRVEIVDP
ncbi:MAG: peptidoglycan-associated lipoprotein Pal [Gammaproteobacteria bacterium]|nr:peptidoglycan-associated lipoprotein Pal [Gammaproteobacteria bacterium]MCY4358155.1 peptidoglycan-associated lipoprotein Pal [Gammaproteobacteria bacterium]